MVSSGFLEITPWLSSSQDVELPDIKQGVEYEINSIEIKEGKTTSPGYLTESDLISCMEANEIGTDASIPTHIKNIIDRGYVKVNTKKGRSLVPTNLGMALGRAYCEIDSELILPKVRSYIEKSCDAIAKGKVTFKSVVDHVLKTFKQKFEFYSEQFALVDKIIKSDFVDKYGEERKKDKGNKNQAAKDYKEIGFPQEMRSYEHCKLFEEVKTITVEKTAHLHCNICKNKGTMKKIKPKNKRDTSIHLRCSQCKYEFSCFKDCDKFEILKNGCENCNSSLVRVNYPVKDSPFPMSANQHTGCLFCDEVYKEIVEYPEASENSSSQPENKKAEDKPADTGGIIISKKKKR